MAAADLIDASDEEPMMEPAVGFSSAEPEVEISKEKSAIDDGNSFLVADNEGTASNTESEEPPSETDGNEVEDLEPTSENPSEAVFEEVEEIIADIDIEEEVVKLEVEETPEPDLPPRSTSAEPSQSELELDGGPKGKFEGENPNFHEGEDLDLSLIHI